MPRVKEPRKQEQVSVLESLHHDHFSPEELSKLLGIDIHVIQQAAHTGRLKAFIVDHHILDIHREDVLEWLRTR